LNLSFAAQACDLADVADLGRLKFRDRDVLAAGLQAWRASSAPFDIADLWDRRVRAHLGKRYDAADGSFDWDYRRGLGSQAGGDLVHLKQYRHWRRTGVAFEFGDQTYARPNRTLATFVEGHLKRGKDRGRKKEVRGYWGDMAVGPFAGLGVACDAGPHVDALLEVADKGHATEQRKHNATEVAVYNVLSYLFAIETGAPYAMTRPGDIFSGLGALKDRDAVAHAEHIVESLDGVVFAPLAGPADAALARLAPGSVDAAYLSVNAAQLLESPAFRAALKPGAAVTAEKARLVVPLADQEKRTFDGKVRDLAEAHGFAEAHDDADAVRFAFAAAAE
jgi:dynein assembly factor 3